MGRRTLIDIDNKILNAVMAQSYRHGIESISTKEIASKLGVSEIVIFSRYKTKAGLLESTFVKAWNTIPHVFSFPMSESIEDKKKAFLAFQKEVKESFSYKKELVYVLQYMNAHAGPHDRILAIQKPYRDEIGKTFLSLKPNLTLLELEQIEDNYIETTLTTYMHFVKNHYPMDYNSLSFYFLVRDYGYQGFISFKGDLKE